MFVLPSQWKAPLDAAHNTFDNFPQTRDSSRTMKKHWSTPVWAATRYADVMAFSIFGPRVGEGHQGSGTGKKSMVMAE